MPKYCQQRKLCRTHLKVWVALLCCNSLSLLLNRKLDDRPAVCSALLGEVWCPPAWSTHTQQLSRSALLVIACTCRPPSCCVRAEAQHCGASVSRWGQVFTVQTVCSRPDALCYLSFTGPYETPALCHNYCCERQTPLPSAIPGWGFSSVNRQELALRSWRGSFSVASEEAAAKGKMYRSKHVPVCLYVLPGCAAVRQVGACGIV
jgi:hypothetical protein